MRLGVHYLSGVTGTPGVRWFEWVSRESGTVRTFEGSRADFVRCFGGDVTRLPEDHSNVSA